MYKLNGYKIGTFKGWYLVVKPTKKEYAVDQLCLDSKISFYLLSNEKFDTEDEAKKGIRIKNTISGTNAHNLKL